MIAHILIKIYKMIKIAKVLAFVWILLNGKKIQLTQNTNIYEEIILLEISLQNLSNSFLILKLSLTTQFFQELVEKCCILGQINKSLLLEISIAMK